MSEIEKFTWLGRLYAIETTEIESIYLVGTPVGDRDNNSITDHSKDGGQKSNGGINNCHSMPASKHSCKGRVGVHHSSEVEDLKAKYIHLFQANREGDEK